MAIDSKRCIFSRCVHQQNKHSEKKRKREIFTSLKYSHTNMRGLYQLAGEPAQTTQRKPLPPPLEQLRSEIKLLKSGKGVFFLVIGLPKASDVDKKSKRGDNLTHALPCLT